jgi:hypothetical protein
MQEYKPNIYPIMYWAILYGVVTTLVLFALNLLASYMSLLWFPIFLVGLIWGGYRRYEKDKKNWMEGQGLVGTSKAPLEEFKDAVRDIAQATQEMIAKHKAEDTQKAAQESVEQQAQATPDNPTDSEQLKIQQ